MSKGHRHSHPRLDASNIAGLTTLMNPMHLKDGINLADVERKLMGRDGGERVTAPADPVKIWTNELNELANELGIALISSEDAPQQCHEERDKGVGRLISDLGLARRDSS